MIFDNEFLVDRKECLNNIKEHWKMNETEFKERVETWFDNFKTLRDRELALKILEHINYYSKERFDTEMEKYGQELVDYIKEINKDPQKMIVIVPNNRGDSADMHGYNLTKLWGIKQSQIISIKELSEQNISDENVFVIFNDTHGTGKQFVYEMLKPLEDIMDAIENPVLCVVSITITSKALDYFEYYLKDKSITLEIIPKQTVKTVFDDFLVKDYLRIEELCSKVYPSHPLGFGNAGLLTAYYFQCPNNSLPLIWANGENNACEGNATHWKPLFEYKPKVRDKKVIDNDIHFQNYIDKKIHLQFSLDELIQINTKIKNWKYNEAALKKMLSMIRSYFNIFNQDEKDLALKIFQNLNMMSLSATRDEIKALRDKVMGQVRKLKGEKSDIVLVLTGFEKESTYHYIFDFLKIWDLKVSQAITLEDLVKYPYEALNKHLVFFYHTRADNEGYFEHEIWEKVKDLPSRCNYVIAYMMADCTKEAIGKIKKSENKPMYIFCNEKISRPISRILAPDDIKRLKNIYHRFDVNADGIENRMLTLFYFGYRKDLVLSLLWYKKFLQTPKR